MVGLAGVVLEPRRMFPSDKDLLQTEAQIKNVYDHPTELVCMVREQSGADAVRAYWP